MEVNKSKPFTSLKGVEPALLLNYLQQEHPQIIASVLSYLEPKIAAIIIQELPNEVKSDVLRRISTLDRISPETLGDVERVLWGKISALSSEDSSASGGLEDASKILKFLDKASLKQVFEGLADDDPELAEALINKLREKKRYKSILCRIKKLNDKSIDKSIIDRITAAKEKAERGMVFVQPAGCKVKKYDFKRPMKFTEEQILSIFALHETFARLTTTSLSVQLRSMVHVHVMSVDQLPYEEFIRSIPTPTTLVISKIETLKGYALMEIDPVITFSIIGRLLGGSGEGTKSQHELSDIEFGVIERVIVKLLSKLREAWLQVIDIKPGLGQIDTNPQFAQIVPPTEIGALVTFGVKVDNVDDAMPPPNNPQAWEKLDV